MLYAMIRHRERIRWINEKMIKRLQTNWFELAAKYSSQHGDIKTLLEEIFSAYSGKERHYHNLDHIDQLLQMCDAVREDLADIDTLRFSIWYHDFVYDVRRKDNEEKSAETAADHLKKLGWEEEKIQKCTGQILATANHPITPFNENNDTLYLLDFDLSILGADPATYADYSRRIRMEYGIYPDNEYKNGRKKVLQYFLQSERIFKTAYYFNTYERQARENLKKELDEIG